MLAPSSGLLRAGIGLKLSQIKLATRSYLRDRTNQATGTVTSYAIAAGLFAAAGIFLIAACLVGIAALFRWIEIHYGQFWAFGAVGALLVPIAAICAGVGRGQAETTVAAVSHRSPAACAWRSRPIRSSRTRSKPRGIPPPRSCWRLRRHRPRPARAPAITAGAEQQEYSGRPDRDGDAAGLGGARDGDRRRGERTSDVTRPAMQDNLLLIAATAILVLTAQRLFSGRHAPAPIGGFGGRARRRPAARDTAARMPTTRPRVRRASWKTILWRIYERSNDDRLLATAAGVVFFGLLAVFPAVTALVSCYGLFADPATIGANLQTLALMLPEGSFQIVQDQIARVLAKGHAALGGNVPVRPCARDLERQCRRQGDHRRAQRRL